MLDKTSQKSLEKYSCAVTLSDMEIFIFPELMYSLVLTNIMSPRLWEWKKDPWFKDLHKMNDYRKLLRTKQFIMNNFTFNLDLDTWGLTTKEKELNRFESYIDKTILSQSNALFGYEGDKYYFDINIRKHFGLEKYTDNVIPYWKTETIEAMEAFKYKENYGIGAGECVSFSTLYAAALFVIAGISLDKIHLIATPLHSQSFIDLKDGIISNNRRIVTKNMWFNGTELSAKARRALENEKITMIVNNHGYIHTMYKEQTMPYEKHQEVCRSLKNYLKIGINYYILTRFLKQHNSFQQKFQIEHELYGKKLYIELETVFHHEDIGKSKIGDKTQDKLLNEISPDEYYADPIEHRVILNNIEKFFNKTALAIERLKPDSEHSSKEVTIKKLITFCNEFEDFFAYFSDTDINLEQLAVDLVEFTHIEPYLPVHNNSNSKSNHIDLSNCKTQSEVISYLESIRKYNTTADLSFSTLRDMSRAPWEPFLKAAYERNPVSIELNKDNSIDEIYTLLNTFKNESIYDLNRLAQPDEVWNYKRGDGIEKAILLGNILTNRNISYNLEGENKNITVSYDNREFHFESLKEIELP